jgi:hypothetical protein
VSLALGPVSVGVFALLNVAALTALAPGGVCDDAAQGTTFPFVFYEVSERDIRGFGTGGLPEVELRVHAFTQYGGLKIAQATPRVVCLGFEGQVLGAAFIGVSGAFSFVYEVLAQVKALTKANVSYLVSGLVDRGQIVQPLAVKAADWNTKTLGTVVDYTLDPAQRVIPITSNTIANPSVVTTPVPHGYATGDIVLIAGVATSSPTINGQRTVTVVSPTTYSVPVNVTVAGTGGSAVRANSPNGGVGYQQITALSGFSGFVGKLRDSADDTTYADLITFANVTAAPSAERQAVAGVVDRYLSYDGNVTGSGSITAFSGFCRS